MPPEPINEDGLNCHRAGAKVGDDILGENQVADHNTFPPAAFLGKRSPSVKEELIMPAWLAQQEDENKGWDARSFARRLASLACSASVHGVPAPPLPNFDFLRSYSCQLGWLNKTMKIPDLTGLQDL